MTLANDSSITGLVADTPQFIQVAIERILGPLRAQMVDYERRLSAVEAREDSEAVTTLRTDLASLHEEMQSMQPSISFDDTQFTIPQAETGPILPFADLFGYSPVGEETEMEFGTGLSEDQQVELAKRKSIEELQAQAVGAGPSSQPFEEAHTGAQSEEAPTVTATASAQPSHDTDSSA